MFLNNAIKRIITFVFLVFFIPENSLASSLEEALILTYQNNPELMGQRESLKATHEKLPQAYSGWLPSASVDLSTGQERVKIGNRAPGDDDVSKTEISITQPVFNGFETISKTNKAHGLINAANAELYETEQKILMDTVNAYVDLVENQEILTLSSKNEHVLKEHFMATEEKFKLGDNTKTDVAQAKARLSEAISERINAEGVLASSAASYKRIIGEDPTNSKLPQMLPMVPKTLSDAANIATASNPTLIKATHEEKVASEDIGISISSLLPSLNLVGKVRRSDGASTFGSGKIENDSLLLNLSIPLYQSGSEYSKVREAKIEAKKRKFEKIDTRNRVLEEVAKTWNELHTARSTISSNWDVVEAAKLALEGVKQEAEHGKRTVLDVLDAEQELFESKVNLVKAKSNEVRAVYNLKSAIGQLNIASLGLNTSIHNTEIHLEDIKYKMIGF